MYRIEPIGVLLRGQGLGGFHLLRDEIAGMLEWRCLFAVALNFTTRQGNGAAHS